MKKVVIGMVALTGLFFAGQASATTWADSLNTYVGPVKMKLMGFSAEGTEYTGTTGYAGSGAFETWGIFQVTNLYTGEYTTTDTWSSTANNTQYFGIYHGLYDVSVLQTAPNDFTIGLGADTTGFYKAGFEIYEVSPSDIGTLAPADNSKRIDFNHYQGMVGKTLALAGEFESGASTDPLVFIQQFVTSTTLPANGTGFGFGSFTGGTYLSRFASNGISDGTNLHDFSMNFTLQGIFIEDPVKMNAVPEPATMLLFGTGLAGLAGLRRKRKE